MRKTNRILAFVLTLVLCAALLPAAVLAAGGNEAQSSGSVSQAKHTVTFIAGGEVFATVLVPDGDRLGNMPQVPEIPGYTGKWDKTVDLVTCSVPVTAIYTPTQSPSPRTGDLSPMWLALPLLLLSTAAVVMAIKSKEQ